MSDNRLRTVLREFLADLRAAGRGASSLAIERIVANRLPSLAAAADAHADAELAQHDQDRIVRAMSLRARELNSASLNGQAHGIPWLRKRATQPRPEARRWSWGLGLAGAAALLMVGWMLYSALNKPILVKHEPKSGTSVPIPKGPEKRPEGPVVKGGTPPEKKLIPKPGPKKQETLVAVNQPKVGKLGSVMGKPMVYAAGSKKGIVARPGMSLAMGATIETGDADKLELKFTDGTTLRLDFNTKIEIPKSDIAHRASRIARPDSITLDSGRLYAMVTHQEEGSHFKVVTPAATAEVLGTEFGLRVERLPKKQIGPDYKTTLQVKRGKVRFYNSLGERTATDSTESWATEQSRPTELKRVLTLHRRFGNDSTFHMFSRRLALVDALSMSSYPAGWTGIDVSTASNGDLTVGGIWYRSPGASSGIKVGDIVLSVNGNPVRSAVDWTRLTRRSGTSLLSVRVRRGESELTIAVRTSREGKNPSTSSPEFLGRLQSATWEALTGDAEVGRKALEALASETDLAEPCLDLGLLYLTQDKVTEAVRWLKSAVRRNPKSSAARVALAKALELLGNSDRAIEEYQVARSLDPSNRRLILKLAEGHYRAGRFSEALALSVPPPLSSADALAVRSLRAAALHALNRHAEAAMTAREVLQVDPYHFSARKTLVGALEGLNQLEEAEVVARETLTLHPTAVESDPLLLANVLFAQSRIAEGIRLLERAVADGSKSLTVWGTLAQQYMEMGRNAEALQTAKKALSLDPEDPVLWGILIHAEGTLGLERAETVFEESVASIGEHPWTLRAIAWQRSANRSYDRAEEAARRLVELWPWNREGRIALAQALAANGHTDEAEAQFRKAISDTDADDRSLEEYANFLNGMGKLDEARTHMANAVAKNPWHFVSPARIGRFQRICGGAEASVEVLRRAVQLRPGTGVLYGILGRVLRSLGRRDESIQALGEAVAQRSTIELDYCLVADDLRTQNRWVEAEKLLIRSIGLFPENPHPWMHLGEDYRRQGRFEEAIRATQESLKIDDKYNLARQVLGTGLIQSGEYGEAERVFRRYLELEPRSVIALDGIAYSVAMQHERLDEAERFCFLALGTGERTASVIETLRLILKERGRDVDAAAARAYALEKDPSLAKFLKPPF